VISKKKSCLRGGSFIFQTTQNKLMKDSDYKHLIELDESKGGNLNEI